MECSYEIYIQCAFITFHSFADNQIPIVWFGEFLVKDISKYDWIARISCSKQLLTVVWSHKIGNRYFILMRIVCAKPRYITSGYNVIIAIKLDHIQYKWIAFSTTIKSWTDWSFSVVMLNDECVRTHGRSIGLYAVCGIAKLEFAVLT